MMNNTKKTVSNIDLNNPEDARKLIESLGIKIPDGMTVTAVASNIAIPPYLQYTLSESISMIPS